MCNIKLRIANKNDLQLLYCWAIDLDVRANAIETKSISWNQHVSWFNIKLNSKDSKIYIGEINRVPFGQLRFDKIDGIHYIDYSVVSSERGKGLGSKLIQAGIKKKIKYDTNKSVFKAFYTNGFLGQPPGTLQLANETFIQIGYGFGANYWRSGGQTLRPPHIY